MVEDNRLVQINLQEFQALEALVYAARAKHEGHESWITIRQALEHLDYVRSSLHNNEDQLNFFEDA